MEKTAKQKIGNALGITVVLIPLVIMIIVCFIPFCVLISSSFTANEIVSKGVVMFPKGFTTLAYRLLFMESSEVLKAYGVTICVTSLGTVINMFLCCLIAYPLSDKEFRWRKPITFFVFFTMLFQVGLIPQYIVITRMFHLNDTMAILIIIPLLAPGHVLFLMAYFQGVDKAIFESARIDGAKEITLLFNIAVPLIVPGLVTIGFQIIIMYWNDAYTSLYFADSIIPVALYIQRWQTYVQSLKVAAQGGLFGLLVGSADDIPDVTVQFALAVFTTIPLIIIFLCFQRFYVKGLTAGAVKG